MITWLASYPRSGNTLTRMILNDVFNAAVPSIYEEDRTQHEYDWGDLLPPTETHRPAHLTREQFIDYARASEETFFIKTHMLPPNSEEPAILVVRDGRAAIASYAAYQKSFLAHPRSLAHLVLGETFIANWSVMNAAWLNRAAPTLVLRFENISADPAAAIAELAQFTGKAPQGGFTRSFSEMHDVNPAFFREGSNAPGIAHVEQQCGSLFWAVHGDLMQSLGYGADMHQPKTNALYERALAEAGAAMESYVAAGQVALTKPAAEAPAGAAE